MTGRIIIRYRKPGNARFAVLGEEIRVVENQPQTFVADFIYVINDGFVARFAAGDGAISIVMVVGK